MRYLFLIFFLMPSICLADEFMKVYGPSDPPYGYVFYCRNNENVCHTQGSTERVNVTIEKFIELDEINEKVNSSIEPVSDDEVYGVSEYWTLPVSNKGDCEDFALLKQKLLMDRGWPSSSLLLTVVADEKNQGHAVLTVRTNQGDFVLDNKNKTIQLWNELPYHYLMRQSYFDPQVWVSLTSQETATTNE